MKFIILFKAAFLVCVLSSYSQDELAKVKAEKQRIDKHFNQISRKENPRFLVFVKIPKKNRLVQVSNEKWPEEVEYTYNIFKDANGKILSILSSPYSESGDWDVSYVHYFDAQGKTIAFERRTGFFNSECTDDAAHETICKYYDGAFKQISRTYKLTDSKGKNLIKSKCVFNYDFTDYKIYRNLNDCLRGYNIVMK